MRSPGWCLGFLLLACGGSDDAGLFASTGSGAGTAGSSAVAGQGQAGEAGTNAGGSSPGGQAGDGGTAQGGAPGGGQAGAAQGGQVGEAGGPGGVGGEGGVSGSSGQAGASPAGASGVGGVGPAGQGGAGGSAPAGAGGQQAGASGAGQGGAGGQTGGCTPGAVESCYGGPAGTVGVGSCKAGQRTCQADHTFGACEGEVTPKSDGCDGEDASCDGQWSPVVPTGCPTIQAAIDAAGELDAAATIQVLAGTYKENLDWKGTSAKVIGAGADVTTIDGGFEGSVVSFHGGELSEARLSGFRITHGTGTKVDGDTTEGGCIWIEQASPTLDHLRVESCSVQAKYGYGGGLYLRKSSSRLEDLVVTGNSSSYYGGGIALSQAGVTMRRVVMATNSATYGGGLVSYFSSWQGTNVAWLSNQASFGGGLYVQGNAPKLENLVFLANSAKEGGAMAVSSKGTPSLVNVSFGGGAGQGSAVFQDDGGDASLDHCHAHDNTPPVFAGLSPSCLAGAPKFVSVSGAPGGWDLHLQAGSPLRDAGSPDLEDLDGSVSDIGYHGGPGAAP